MTQISKSESVAVRPKTVAFEPKGSVYKEPIKIVADIGELDADGPKPYKPVRFADHHPLEGYYDDGHNSLYNVARLVEMCKDLEPFHAPLQAFDLSIPIWQDYSVFDLAFHIKAVNDADLDHPIILDWNGAIADGRHRLIKALVLGHSTIKCVRMYWKPEADKQKV